MCGQFSVSFIIESALVANLVAWLSLGEVNVHYSFLLPSLIVCVYIYSSHTTKGTFHAISQYLQLPDLQVRFIFYFENSANNVEVTMAADGGGTPQQLKQQSWIMYSIGIFLYLIRVYA